MPGNPYRDPESQLCEGASDPNSRRRQTDGRGDHSDGSPIATCELSTSPVVKCLAALADEGGVPPRKRKL
jgi:hypothetical protein